MDSFFMVPHFGVEFVAFKVVINSQLIFVASLRKYRSLFVPLLWQNSIHSGVAYVGGGPFSCNHFSPQCHMFPCVRRYTSHTSADWY
jgi:hypothetical protein